MQYTRTAVQDDGIYDVGPYEAIIVNNLDPMYMGTLEVELIRHRTSANTPRREGQIHTVRYLSPFYGVTSERGLTPNDGYEYTQKSYGFWAVPPDVGTKVLVMFAEGHAAYGYWIGCIQDNAMNFMVPDGRPATTIQTEGTPQNIKGAKLPVGEYNKLTETGQLVDPTFFPKPYNKDFTEILEVQGLLFDEARGQTTSSARREIPSMVFGMSTPGPLDKRQGAPTHQYGDERGSAQVPYNRLGGSSWVMDDGDDKFVRATHAEDGPPIYVNKEAGAPGGDETIPKNEQMRFRTRTGHQIILHNSEDLIYIGNSRGTAWLEFTSDGKIDIYARDSVSVFSDNDINFTAMRDFNVDAGRNINMRATARWSDTREESQGRESGRVQIESRYNTNILVGKDYKLHVKNQSDTVVDKNMKVLVKEDYHLHSNHNIHIQADDTYNEIAGKGIFEHALSGGSHELVNGDKKTEVTASIHRLAGTQIYDTANTTINLKATGLIAGDAEEIHWNSGLAASATPSNSANTAQDAAPVVPLTTMQLPYIMPGNTQPIPYDSILCRAPQHEPWPHHENLNPQAYKTPETDREAPGQLPINSIVLTPDTFLKNKGESSTYVNPHGAAGDVFTGSTGEDNYVGTPTGSRTPGSDGGLANGTYVTPDGTNYEIDPARSDGTRLGRVFVGDGPLDTITTSRRGLTTRVAACFKDQFQGLVDDLEATGYEIRILRGYEKRTTVSGNSWSAHASGLAIDINPPTPAIGGNPNGYHAPRPADAPRTDMPVEAVRQIVAKYGLAWGGDWTGMDDAMHFSVLRSEGARYDTVANGYIPNCEVPPEEERVSVANGKSDETSDVSPIGESITQTADSPTTRFSNREDPLQVTPSSAPSGGVSSSEVYVIGDSHAVAMGGSNNLAANGARLSAIAQQASQVPDGATVWMTGGHNDVAGGRSPSDISGDVSSIVRSMEARGITVNYVMFPEGSSNNNQGQMAPTRQAISGVVSVAQDLDGSPMQRDGIHATLSSYRNIIPASQPAAQPAASTTSAPAGWTRMTIDGVQYDVGNDYVREGGIYKTFSGNTARSYASSRGWEVPTARIAGFIASRARIIPMPTQPQYDPNSRFYPTGDAAYHTQQIFERTGGSFPDGLVAGHKKDVVDAGNGRTCLWGGAQSSSGGNYEGGGCPHDGDYEDYSQGLRPVRRVG